MLVGWGRLPTYQTLSQAYRPAFFPFRCLLLFGIILFLRFYVCLNKGAMGIGGSYNVYLVVGVILIGNYGFEIVLSLVRVSRPAERDPV